MTSEFKPSTDPHRRRAGLSLRVILNVCARHVRKSAFYWMRRVCVCKCVSVHRWRANQLEKKSEEGAINAQLPLIAPTLFGRTAALCEMTKCCDPPPHPPPPPSCPLAPWPRREAKRGGK